VQAGLCAWREALPQCALIAGGKTHDRQAVQDRRLQPGDLLIFERLDLSALEVAQFYRRRWQIEPFSSGSSKT
jgi:hypothetical protein